MNPHHNLTRSRRILPKIDTKVNKLLEYKYLNQVYKQYDCRVFRQIFPCFCEHITTKHLQPHLFVYIATSNSQLNRSIKQGQLFRFLPQDKHFAITQLQEQSSFIRIPYKTHMIFEYVLKIEMQACFKLPKLNFEEKFWMFEESQLFDCRFNEKVFSKLNHDRLGIYIILDGEFRCIDSVKKESKIVSKGFLINIQGQLLPVVMSTKAVGVVTGLKKSKKSKALLLDNKQQQQQFKDTQPMKVQQMWSNVNNSKVLFTSYNLLKKYIGKQDQSLSSLLLLSLKCQNNHHSVQNKDKQYKQYKQYKQQQIYSLPKKLINKKTQRRIVTQGYDNLLDIKNNSFIKKENVYYNDYYQKQKCDIKKKFNLISLKTTTTSGGGCGGGDVVSSNVGSNVGVRSNKQDKTNKHTPTHNNQTNISFYNDYDYKPQPQLHHNVKRIQNNQTVKSYLKDNQIYKRMVSFNKQNKCKKIKFSSLLLSSSSQSFYNNNKQQKEQKEQNEQNEQNEQIKQIKQIKQKQIILINTNGKKYNNPKLINNDNNKQNIQSFLNQQHKENVSPQSSIFSYRKNQQIHRQKFREILQNIQKDSLDRKDLRKLKKIADPMSLKLIKRNIYTKYIHTFHF